MSIDVCNVRAICRKDEEKNITLPILFDFSTIRIRSETRDQV